MAARSKDGVDVTPASAAQLGTYAVAEQLLDAFKVPKLYDAADTHARVFIALFDGTGNDAIKDPQHITNVGRLKLQIEEIGRKNPHVGHFYKEGPGTQDGLSGLWDRITGGTYTERIEAMYDKFDRQAARWLKEDPDARISLVSVGFSRGAEQAAGFARLVDERGIQDPTARVVERVVGQDDQVVYTAPPLRADGKIPQALGLYDPVATGEPGQHDRRPPPSVVSGIQITAGNEYRAAFPSTTIIEQGVSADGRFLGVTTAGAHSNIGGSYQLDGLSRRNFNLMAKYLDGVLGEDVIKRLDVVPNARLDVIHDSTQHQWFYREVPTRQSVTELDPQDRPIEPADRVLVAPYLREALSFKERQRSLAFGNGGPLLPSKHPALVQSYQVDYADHARANSALLQPSRVEVPARALGFVPEAGLRQSLAASRRRLELAASFSMAPVGKQSWSLPASAVPRRPHGLSITPGEADVVIDAFYNEFQGLSDLKIGHRPTQESYYGPRATVQAVGEIKGAFLPARGEVHLPLSNFRDVRDLRRSLQHEVLGHYATLTFSAADKRALLEVIALARHSPSLETVWGKVDRAYVGQSESMKAEEVFCLAAEDIGASGKSPRRDFAQVWSEVVATKVRPLEREDLQTIVETVAEGIRQGTRAQQIFPKDDNSQYRVGTTQRGPVAQTSAASPAQQPGRLEPADLGKQDTLGQQRHALAAQAFLRAPQVQAVRQFPELAGAYAAMAAFERAIDAKSLRPDVRARAVAAGREDLAGRIERGQVPRISPPRPVMATAGHGRGEVTPSWDR